MVARATLLTRLTRRTRRTRLTLGSAVALAGAIAGLTACDGQVGGQRGAGGAGQPPIPPGTGRAPVHVDCTHVGSGRDIQVGNPTPEAGEGIVSVSSLGEVDWQGLGPGDTVRIFHRAEPYREKLPIVTSGAEGDPIRVCGVPSSEGALPVLSGDGAVAPDVDYGDEPAIEDLAIVVVWSPAYEERPEHVVIEGLHVEGTLGPGGTEDDVLSYVASDGTTRTYRPGAACIRVQEGRDVTLRGNELTGCGQGIFTLARIPEPQITREVRIEGNALWGNGVVGNDHIHQAYLQGIDFVVELNDFGRLREGALGSNVKLRTAGDVVRYNVIDGGARILDYVEPEEHIAWVMPERYAAWAAGSSEDDPSYAALVDDAWQKFQVSYCYGNVLLDVGATGPANLVHFSYDNVQNDRRRGTLWFYFNTVVWQRDFDEQDIVRFYDGGPYYGEQGEPLEDHTEAGYPTVRALDNVFVRAALEGAPSYFEWTRYRADKLLLGKSFMTTGWDAAAPGYEQAFPGYGNAVPSEPSAAYPGGNDTHHVSGAEQLLLGSDWPIDPVTLAPRAVLVGAAAPLPADIPEAHVPRYSLDPVTRKPLVRQTIGTLGALEAPP